MEEKNTQPEQTTQKPPSEYASGEKKKNIVPIVISVLVVIIVLVSVWLALQMFLAGEETNTPVQQASPQAEEIEDAADLKKLENQVNSEELESLEEEIEKNAQDLQEF